MQNEACIKQGSEKESFRQQLIDAKQRIKFFMSQPEFDDAEKSAIEAIFTAAEEQKMSPKAFLQAANAIEALARAKDDVFHVGYTIEEMVERDCGVQLYELAKIYMTVRAQVLGFQKSLTPSGWDILED
jgi:imidazolonepropionase-like amidohydrolase